MERRRAAGPAHEQAPQGAGTTAREPGGQQRRMEPAPSAVARRYDYLYSADELAPWLDTVRRIAEQGADGYVIANNHFRGKAAVNALQIKAALEGAKVEVPAEPARRLPGARPDRETGSRPPPLRVGGRRGRPSRIRGLPAAAADTTTRRPAGPLLHFAGS